MIPQSAKQVAAGILIFTDPAAMGLFFMGAVVLFEKSQRVESSLAVSPIKTREYICAKVFPFIIIGTIVAVILCLFSNAINCLVILGVMFSSLLFSLCGLLVATSIKTLNGFIIATIPFEIVLCFPAMLYAFGILKSTIWLIHPGVAAMRLILGVEQFWYLDILSLMIWILPVYCICKRAVVRSFIRMGGAKI